MAFNQFPYSNFHELNLDWLLNAWKNFTANWSAAKATAKQLPVDSQPTVDLDIGENSAPVFNFGIPRAVGDVDTVNGISPDSNGDVKLPNTGCAHFTKIFRWFINCETGDDSNDGLTVNTPWKSLDKFFNHANTFGPDSRVEMRCYLCASGNYDACVNGENNFTGLAIHISPYTSEIAPVLVFHNTKDLKFYNCHLNLQGCTVELPDQISGEMGFWIDTGGFWCVNCVFKCPLVLYGMTGQISQCSYPTLMANFSVLRLNDNTATNVDMNKNCYSFNTSIITVSKAHHNAAPVEVGTNNAFIQMTRSIMLGGLNIEWNGSASYAYAIRPTLSIILSRKSVIDQWKTRGVNPIFEDPNEGNLIVDVTKTVNLPAT